MRAADIITKKRDGEALSDQEIEFFIKGFSDGSIPDYQAAAWAMAVYFQGMNPTEASALTLAMLHSGEQLNLSQQFPPGKVVVDKHSTGGVGDKTSLVLTPLVASLGLPVGKLSGRGLGYSGGTLDKLESIPGFDVSVSQQQFVQQLQDIGIVLGGQTAELAPADGKLYALRDVTGTIPSIPLIASSIMSKKLATGAQGIVLDVKVGYGAFLSTLDAARRLAELMVQIGTSLNRLVTAVISDMNQPLGLAVGNALELKEALDTLQGDGPPDFVELIVTLAGEMLRLGQITADEKEGRRLASQQLANGEAWRKFRQLVKAQGGDLRVVDDPQLLPSARLVEQVQADSSGWIAEIRADQIGLAVAELGGGRQRKGDSIDHAVGIVLAGKIGKRVEQGQTLCWIHANSEAHLAQAYSRVERAYQLSPEPAVPPPLIYEILR